VLASFPQFSSSIWFWVMLWICSIATLLAGCYFHHPTNTVKTLKEIQSTSHNQWPDFYFLHLLIDSQWKKCCPFYAGYWCCVLIQWSLTYTLVFLVVHFTMYITRWYWIITAHINNVFYNKHHLQDYSWLSWGLTSHSTQYRSYRRRSFSQSLGQYWDN